ALRVYQACEPRLQPGPRYRGQPLGR
ncbi:hypothetical protein BN1723_019974, partial [Verticillium longisporum]